jgi:ABC-2 type transport system ATP-binding protein
LVKLARNDSLWSDTRLSQLAYLRNMSIKVENVSKRYGNQIALNKVSLQVNKGEILGFLGPNGAGKSTLMKIITSYINADEGKVLVCDELVNNQNIEYRKKVGYLAEHNPLYLDMFVKEYLNFIASIYQSSKERVKEMIEITGLTPEKDKKIHQLSKGYRQRVGLAAALIHNPEVLILDEPTTGLDPNQMVEIRQLIRDCGKDKTVMLSTHIMQEVEKMCHRVIIIHQGNIVADEQLADLKAQNIDLESFFHQHTR